MPLFHGWIVPNEAGSRRRAWVAAHALWFAHWGAGALVFGILALIPCAVATVRQITFILCLMKRDYLSADMVHERILAIGMPFATWMFLSFIAAIAWLLDGVCRKEHEDRPGALIAMLGFVAIAIPFIYTASHLNSHESLRGNQKEWSEPMECASSSQ